MYAWIIDKDHLAEPGDKPGTNMNAVGVIGPRSAPLVLCEALGAGRTVASVGPEWDVFHFQMFDDDGELYYTGRLIVDPDSEHDDEAVCGAPLYDYGQPNAGCTSITYPGHPELDCG